MRCMGISETFESLEVQVASNASRGSLVGGSMCLAPCSWNWWVSYSKSCALLREPCILQLCICCSVRTDKLLKGLKGQQTSPRDIHAQIGWLCWSCMFWSVSSVFIRSAACAMQQSITSQTAAFIDLSRTHENNLRQCLIHNRCWFILSSVFVTFWMHVQSHRMQMLATGSCFKHFPNEQRCLTVQACALLAVLVS